MTYGTQPLLHDAVVALRAPTQAWSNAAGDMTGGVHGFYHSNTRLISVARLRVAGAEVDSIGFAATDASTVVFTAIARGIGEPTADPAVRIDRRRDVSPGAMRETVTLSSTLDEPLDLDVELELAADFSPIHDVKSGVRSEGWPAGAVEPGGVRWTEGGVRLEVRGDGKASVNGMRWLLEVPPGGSATIEWSAHAEDDGAVVEAAPPARIPTPRTADSRLERWLDRALADLDALRLRLRGSGDAFFAAGAPWFLTLFGRDSLWTARFLVPLDRSVALSTLRALARLQGSEADIGSGEQPGKIMHELRPDTLAVPGFTLPPLYYGTIDATPLWVLLMHDVWRAGAAESELRPLLPALRAALGWLRDSALDADGFVAYIDETGTGLANQGWKDSGDSIQWDDGRLAKPPIALSEVQGYAFAAANAGAELLDAFGEPGGNGWREWAAALRQRFHDRFWIGEGEDAYPAVALDADGERVDSVASNMGHLLGTGILDRHEAELVARRLVSAPLNSGFGLRTLSTDAAGYWPFSYHGGSVWAHDTAIAISGLAAEGFGDEARTLAEGLITAAERFEYRMPELHAGDARSAASVPAPYPAACRPQAWSAAAAVAVYSALSRLDAAEERRRAS